MLYTVTAYARYFEIKVLGFEGNPFLRVRSVKYYLGFVERNGGGEGEFTVYTNSILRSRTRVDPHPTLFLVERNVASIYYDKYTLNSP